MPALLKNNQWKEAVKLYDLMNRSTNSSNQAQVYVETFSADRPEIGTLTALAHLHLGTVGSSWCPPDAADMRKHLELAVKLQPNVAKIQLAYGQRLAKDGRKGLALIALHKAANGNDPKAKLNAQKAIQKLEHAG